MIGNIIILGILTILAILAWRNSKDNFNNFDTISDDELESYAGASIIGFFISLGIIVFIIIVWKILF